jgi:hypothetical protein
MRASNANPTTMIKWPPHFDFQTDRHRDTQYAGQEVAILFAGPNALNVVCNFHARRPGLRRDEKQTTPPV